jgi:hypothetical protein
MIKIWRWSSHLFRSYDTFCVFGFGPLVAKQRIRLDRNLVCELLLHSGTYVQSFGSIASAAVTKRALLMDATWLYRLTAGEPKKIINMCWVSYDGTDRQWKWCLDKMSDKTVQASQNLGRHSYFLGCTKILRLSPTVWGNDWRVETIVWW